MKISASIFFKCWVNKGAFIKDENLKMHKWLHRTRFESYILTCFCLNVFAGCQKRPPDLLCGCDLPPTLVHLLLVDAPKVRERMVHHHARRSCFARWRHSLVGTWWTSTPPSTWTIRGCVPLMDEQDCVKMSLPVFVGPLQLVLLVTAGWCRPLEDPAPLCSQDCSFKCLFDFCDAISAAALFISLKVKKATLQKLLSSMDARTLMLLSNNCSGVKIHLTCSNALEWNSFWFQE